MNFNVAAELLTFQYMREFGAAVSQVAGRVWAYFAAIDPTISTTFYSANAAFLGTVFAVLFSFSLFTVQHAASSYEPGLIRTFKTDRKIRCLRYSLLIGHPQVLEIVGETAVFKAATLER